MQRGRRGLLLTGHLCQCIIEVMSPGSEADDAGRKWLAYREIASLGHCLVLAQDRRLVNVHWRAGDIWRERFVSAKGRSSSTIRQHASKSTSPYAATDLAA